LGHAVLCAQPAVNDETFAVILADDLIDSSPPVLRQMTEVFERHQSSVVAVQEIPREHTRQYGIVKTEPVAGDIERVMAIIEKPKPEAAPSTLAVVGRYILTSRIFHHLAQVRPGAGTEIRSARRGSRARVPVQWDAVRLRLEARLLAGDGRVRTQAP
jgi:UTP--glucose-1-phosphate uridylyltransferase